MAVAVVKTEMHNSVGGPMVNHLIVVGEVPTQSNITEWTLVDLMGRIRTQWHSEADLLTLGEWKFRGIFIINYYLYFYDNEIYRLCSR